MFGSGSKSPKAPTTGLLEEQLLTLARQLGEERQRREDCVSVLQEQLRLERKEHQQTVRALGARIGRLESVINGSSLGAEFAASDQASPKAPSDPDKPLANMTQAEVFEMCLSWFATLQSMGFTASQCRRALDATGNRSLDDALQWMFDHPEEISKSNHNNAATSPSTYEYVVQPSDTIASMAAKLGVTAEDVRVTAAGAALHPGVVLRFPAPTASSPSGGTIALPTGQDTGAASADDPGSSSPADSPSGRRLRKKSSGSFVSDSSSTEEERIATVYRRTPSGDVAGILLKSRAGMISFKPSDDGLVPQHALTVSCLAVTEVSVDAESWTDGNSQKDSAHRMAPDSRICDPCHALVVALDAAQSAANGSGFQMLDANATFVCDPGDLVHMYTLLSSANGGTSFDVLLHGWDADTTQPLLTDSQVGMLNEFLPATCQYKSWGLLYSLTQHGSSIRTFYR
jgi:hypothetical protein